MEATSLRDRLRTDRQRLLLSLPGPELAELLESNGESALSVFTPATTEIIMLREALCTAFQALAAIAANSQEEETECAEAAIRAMVPQLGGKPADGA